MNFHQIYQTESIYGNLVVCCWIETLGWRKKTPHSSPDYTLVNVVDIDYSSWSKQEYSSMRNASKSDNRVLRVFGKEENDKALHLEIPVLRTAEQEVIRQKTTELMATKMNCEDLNAATMFSNGANTFEQRYLSSKYSYWLTRRDEMYQGMNRLIEKYDK